MESTEIKSTDIENKTKDLVQYDGAVVCGGIITK